MAMGILCLVLQRVILPVVLILSALIRPVGISFVYLLMFFISPFIPVASRRNFKGAVTAYLIILIALSVIILLCHIGLQVVIAVLRVDDDVFGQCSFTVQLLRHIGFIDLRNLKYLAIIEWLAPEILVLITSVIVYLVTKKLSTASIPSQLESGVALENIANEAATLPADAATTTAAAATTSENNATAAAKNAAREDRINFDSLIKISPLFCLATLFFAAVLRPSVPGGFYFLIFLLSGSYWATFQSLKRGFAMILRFVVVVIVLHLLCIVAYQTPWMQEHLSKDSLIARLIGLEPLITSSCTNDIRIFVFNNAYKADSFMNPIVLSFTYYAFALTTKNLIKPRIVTKPAAFGLENGSKKYNRQLSLITQSSSTRGSKKESNWTKAQRLNVSLRRETRPTNTTTTIEPTETTPLVRHASRKTRTISQSNANTENAQSRTEGIQLDNLDGTQRTEDEGHSSFMDQITYGIISIGGFIYQNSYIFTNILMMAWSIVYHSWLTFILLLWGNLLWMIPNQRKAMMRSSPFIALYAELLLVAQYIYGMNLTNDELPSKVDITGINLQQIGFERPQEHGMQPCIPLVVKTLFVLMFWVTLRQFFKEKSEKRRTSAIADMIAPLQLTLGSTGEPLHRPDAKKTSKFLKKTGAVIKNLLVRLWIWLLVLVIFLCAITGQQMTGFRICYMGLFLFFLLVFQSSSKAWVKIMYGFWLFLIFYAMSILILIYTYQFDKFDQYWYDYLNVSKTVQKDIGLERYKTKELFLHLLSPTIIVILTVIQVHYFHNRFIESLDHSPDQTTNVEENAQPKQPSRVESRLSTAANKCPTSVRRVCRKIWNGTKMFLKGFKSIFWPFLELHILKAVYIVAFVCSTSEVCVLHIAFVGLCALGVIARMSVQVFISRIISFIVTIIILTKMIYQVAYLDHSHYDVYCTSNNATNITENNAVWFGLQKATEAGGLMSLLKQYIIYMVFVTLHAVVSLRQMQMRLLTGTDKDQPADVLFPGVNRADAEKNLKGMIKYLFNYGFYKFGMEICLITIVITVVSRQDIISIVYVAGLVVLLCCNRTKSAYFLRVFQYFVAIMIFVQYVFLVSLPPGLCINYFWEHESYGDSIQRWAMLPGHLHYNHARKLIFDFIMLMIINRQCWVFALENRLERNKEEYPGGTNKSVIDDIANLFTTATFDNPTRDFLSHIRNYLDIFKNAILCGFYWVTLAIVFLAGTNISDFMALGYLIGAFIFLWHGSDFYLRPIQMIIKRWQYLIYYNVFNIVVKTCLQMAGCLFMKELTNNCCWLVHLLGIVCTSNDIIQPKEESSVASILPEPIDECPDTNPHHFLLWDALCFAFLILQLRIFKSHYFCHIIIDTRAISNLASRGAELIEDLRQKQIMHRHAHEKEVLHKIKRKMEKIRATQQKMLRPLDKPTHFDEYGYPVHGSRPLKRSRIKYHPEAVRAGDYYMFEDMDDKFELDLIDDDVDFLDDQDKIIESEKKMSRRKTLADVWKDIQGEEFRRKVYVRQRSYASAPGSRIGLKIDEEFLDAQSSDMMGISSGGGTSGGADGVAGVRTSTHSEPLTYALRSSSEYFDHGKADAEPSTSQGIVNAEKQAESKPLDETDSAIMEAAEEQEEEVKQRNPMLRLMEAFFVSIVVRLNRFSRNYRYVNKILTEEKRAWKDSQRDSNLGRATNSAMFNVIKKNIESDESPNGFHANSKTNDNDELNTTNVTTSNYASPTSAITTTTNYTTATETPQSLSQLQSPQQQQPPLPQQQLVQQQQQMPLVDIIEMSLDTVDVARTDFGQEPGSSNSLTRGAMDAYAFEEEDFAARDHNICIEMLISLWYAILSNTDLICYIVVFVNQVVNANIISLTLPLMVFLWGTLSLPRPTKTFWVTLIAFTKGVVLLKCIFQYKIIWAKYNNSPREPLAPAKIFGVEMNPHYASYDLALLLVLFFHRFILKSQGLWKSEYQEDGVIIQSTSTEKDIALVNDDADETNALRPLTPTLQSAIDQEQPISKIKSDTSITDEDKDTPSDNQRSKYFSSLRKFFWNLTKKARLPTDVYALMFLCDFINFFVLLFGFSSFSSRQVEGSGGVATYLTENKVPMPFLIMLLVQFLLIVIDRAIYLRKSLLSKIIFHFCSVIGIHIWMFLVVPAVTERSFYKLGPPIVFYIIKCFYMLLSSYQIKCGFPKRILGNFLTKSFSMVNMLSFKLYMLIPFLYELRTILDWVCTDTTMTMFDWLKMEDIFSEIYFIKCGRQMENDFPVMRAQKKAIFSKLLMGGTGIIMIVILIWGPLCIFALSNAVGQPNLPYEVSVSIRIGSYDPIYSTINRESMIEFSQADFNKMQSIFVTDSAKYFLSNYDASDIAAIKLAGNAPSLWSISPPDKERLLKELQEKKNLTARFTYSFARNSPSKGLLTNVGSEITAALDDTFADRDVLIELLQGNTEKEVILPALVPKFLKILNSGETLKPSALVPDSEEYRPLRIRTHQNKLETWWEISDYCEDAYGTNILKQIPHVDCTSSVVMYTFNDKKFPSTLVFLTGGGIIGAYSTFVLLASRFIKGFFSGQNRKIMFEDLPYVDRVLQLCLDIYLVREALEFALEEDLFAKLIFLYRSPETLIKWTRPKEEINDDETDTDSLRSRRPEQLIQQH